MECALTATGHKITLFKTSNIFTYGKHFTGTAISQRGRSIQLIHYQLVGRQKTVGFNHINDLSDLFLPTFCLGYISFSCISYCLAFSSSTNNRIMITNQNATFIQGREGNFQNFHFTRFKLLGELLHELS